MMGRYIVLILFAFLVEGVFGDAAEVKSVNDGDPVILNTGVTKGPNGTVWWYFNDILIGEINGMCCLYDGPDGRFRDRLMLDCKTGSLTITNITAAHAGRYEAKLKRYNPSDKTEKLNRNPKCDRTRIIFKKDNPGETIKSISLTVSGVFGDAAKVKSVMEGNPVILKTDVNKGPNDMVRWYFNDILIALINGDPKATCLYDGEDGRFRDRLMLDCKTGSLIISNITTQHTGRYEAEIKREDPSGTVIKLNRDPKCESTKIIPKNGNLGETIKSFSLTVSALDFGKNKNEAQIVPEDKEMETSSGLSPAAVAGICVGVILLLAAAVVVVVVVGVMIYRRRRSRNGKYHLQIL
uniref:Uncharacterized protein n=1 Tax=Cyprinus carpio TaxID=7962 RepID=A0A8C1SPD5_CYPCA